MESVNSLNKNSFLNQDNKEFLNKSKYNRKMRSWCSLCYSFFDNGPLSKICKDHLNKGSCNIIDCKKGPPYCVRKFQNINSENRHTICVTQNEVDTWDKSIMIQNYQGDDNQINIINNNSLNTKQAILDHSDSRQFQFSEDEKNPWTKESQCKENDKSNPQILDFNYRKSNTGFDLNNKEFENYKLLQTSDLMINKNYSGNYDYLNQFKSSDFNLFNSNVSSDQKSIQSQDNICNKIFDNSNKKISNFEGEEELIDDFKKIYFNTVSCSPLSKESNEKKNKQLVNNNFNQQKSKATSTSIQTDDLKNTIYKDLDVKTGKSNNEKLEILTNPSVITNIEQQNYYINNNMSIDELFEQVHENTKIAKTILNKLKKAFKQKGLTNAKIIRLMRNKQNNWNFLYEDFKDVCTQHQGVALIIENLLDRTIN